MIDLIEKENEIKEKIDMMEDDISTATSPTPFTRNQPMGATHHRGGNLPTPQVSNINKHGPSHSYDDSIYFRPK